MKAIALFSGGLDSALAIKLILQQNIELEAVHFSMPFYQRGQAPVDAGHKLKELADRLGAPLKVLNITNEALEIVKHPQHGYGKNINPCIDCHILMCKKAKEYMGPSGASFVITGEVLGQRPKSQHRAALRTIEKESGLEGLILRPLSAKLLAETLPEKEGWVDREKLLQINGRSRTEQISKATELDIGAYPSPAGGCLLADPGFTRRMKDLMEYNGLNLEDIKLLKLGRHFRLSKEAKLIVGRNEQENNELAALRQAGDIYSYPVEDKGPIAVGRGEFSRQDSEDAAKIVARYCDNHANPKVKIKSRIWPEGETRLFEVKAADEAQLQRFRV